MVSASKPRLTVDEFLAWAETQEGDFELAHGVVVAMNPPLLDHGLIQGTVHSLLRAGIGRRPCIAVIEAGIRRADTDDQWYQADVAVTCTQQPRGARWMESPVVIVEVLSESTATRDRGEKLPDYMAIPSVQDVLLIDSTKRHVTHCRRHEDGWFVRNVIGTGAVELRGVPVTMTLDDIYDRSGL